MIRKNSNNDNSTSAGDDDEKNTIFDEMGVNEIEKVQLLVNDGSYSSSTDESSDVHLSIQDNNDEHFIGCDDTHKNDIEQIPIDNRTLLVELNKIKDDHDSSDKNNMSSSPLDIEVPWKNILYFLLTTFGIFLIFTTFYNYIRYTQNKDLLYRLGTSPTPVSYISISNNKSVVKEWNIQPNIIMNDTTIILRPLFTIQSPEDIIVQVQKSIFFEHTINIDHNYIVITIPKKKHIIYPLSILLWKFPKEQLDPDNIPKDEYYAE